MNLLDLADLYTERKSLRPASSETYKYSMRAVIRHCPALGLDIKRITPEMISDFKLAALKKIKPISYNSLFAKLKTVLQFAVKSGYLDSNPCAEIPSVRTSRCAKKTMALEQVQKILSAQDLFWRTVTQTFYYTGIRRRQLVGLRWCDLDFENDVIFLRAEFSKNHSERFIPMHKDLKKALQGFREGVLSKSSLSSWPLSAPVFDIGRFSGKMPSALKLSRISCHFYHLSRKLGFVVSPHRFRHMFATVLANSGKVNLRLVQELLCHDDIKTTCGYILPDMASMHRALDRLSSLQ